MRGVRGLYLIRGGAAVPTLTRPTGQRVGQRADDDGEGQAADEMPVMTVEFSRFDT